MPVETFTPSTGSPSQIHYRQAIAPHYLRGSFAEDTVTHDFVADARGKGHFSVAVTTTGTSTYLASIYGIHESTATVGDIGAFAISTGNFVTSTGWYAVIDDPFPFYLLRVQTSDTQDSATPTIRAYGDFSAF